jgi:hypothetical protein
MLGFVGGLATGWAISSLGDRRRQALRQQLARRG